MPLRVVVERLLPIGVSGWAIDDGDPERIRSLVLRHRGEPIVTLYANMMRPDLALEGTRSGRHGFWADFDSDLEILYTRTGGDFVVTSDDPEADIRYYVKTDSGFELRQEASPPITLGFKHASTTDAGPALYGQSFLFDNLAAYNQPLTARATQIPAYHRAEGYYAIKMYVFGDFMWWADDANRTNRTAARYFHTLGVGTRQQIAKGEVMLLFDMSNEGPPARRYADWLLLLHEELYRQGISPAACVLINQNHVFGFDYHLWAREHGFAETMTILNYDYYISRMANILDREPLPGADAPIRLGEDQRAFVCLNFSPRPERTAFVAWLIGSGLAEKGWLSFGGFSNHKMSGEHFGVPDWFPERGIAQSGMAALNEIGALTLDLPSDTQGYTPEFDLGPVDLYDRAAFSIVTESDFSPGDVRRITEKVLKPMALGHPILVMGNPGSLQLLRDLGFKTFHPVIDESYDLFHAPAERMRRLQQEIRRLVELGPHGLGVVRESLASALKHNQRWARRGLAAHYRDVIEPTILQDLADIHARRATWPGQGDVRVRPSGLNPVRVPTLG